MDCLFLKKKLKMKKQSKTLKIKNMKLSNLILIASIVIGATGIALAYTYSRNEVKTEEVYGGDFDKVIQSKTPVIVDFYADWCKPCRIQAPILDELKSELGNKVIIHKVNVDNERVLANRYNIQSIPTIMIFKQGKVIWMNVGVQSKETLKEIVLKNQ